MTKSERDAIVVDHMEMARHIAQRVALVAPAAVSTDDLAQEAMVALTETADRFDPAGGIAFATFANPRITARLIDFAEAERLVAIPAGPHLERVPATYFDEPWLVNHRALA